MSVGWLLAGTLLFMFGSVIGLYEAKTEKRLNDGLLTLRARPGAAGVPLCLNAVQAECAPRRC